MQKTKTRSQGSLETGVAVWFAGLAVPIIAGPIIATSSINPIYQSLFAGLMGGVSQAVGLRLRNTRSLPVDWKRGDLEQSILSAFTSFTLIEIWHANKGPGPLGLELAGGIIAGQIGSELLSPILRRMLGIPTLEEVKKDEKPKDV